MCASWVRTVGGATFLRSAQILFKMPVHDFVFGVAVDSCGTDRERREFVVRTEAHGQ